MQPPALHRLQPFLPLGEAALQGLPQRRQGGTLRHRHRAQNQAVGRRDCGSLQAPSGAGAETCVAGSSAPDKALSCPVPSVLGSEATLPSPHQWDSPFFGDALGGDLRELRGSRVKGFRVPGEGGVSSEPQRSRPCWDGVGAARGHSLGRAGPSLLGGSLGSLIPFQEGLEVLQLEGREQRGSGRGPQRRWGPAARASPLGPAGGWRSTAGG